MRTLGRLGLVAAIVVLSASVAGAAPITYFGEDLNPGGAVPAGGNSETARMSFLSGLVGVGNEDFESIAPGTTPPLALSFPGSSGGITATLTSSSSYPGGVCDTASVAVGGIGCNGFGRFPTSGDSWYHTTNDFAVDFSDPIAAFGFYGTDWGDFQGRVTATLLNGGTVDLTIPTMIGAPSGALMFWGFIDPTDSYSRIEFGITAGAGTDVFGFDDLVIGDQEQISLPEPTSMILFGLGLAGLALFSRRRDA